jgi:choline dehydrogenase-like flavoprotein
MLASDVDALGVRRVDLQWTLGPLDFKTVTRVPHLLAVVVGQAGIGRVKIAYATDEAGRPVIGGVWHHMGTTRMHEDPSYGVVDVNCRVHSVANLYIAGSSVFPTSGHSAPTLTIVALALRLADHLKSRLS